MKYQLSRALWHPAPIELIGPEKVHELHPLLNMDMVSYELTTALLCYYNIAIAQQLVNCKWNILLNGIYRINVISLGVVQQHPNIIWL